MTTLIIKPNPKNKTISVDGVIALNEKIRIRIVGINTEHASNLRMRLRINETEINRFPATETDEWTTIDGALEAIITLDGQVLIDAFNKLDDLAQLDIVAILEDGVTNLNMLALGEITVKNWDTSTSEITERIKS